MPVAIGQKLFLAEIPRVPVKTEIYFILSDFVHLWLVVFSILFLYFPHRCDFFLILKGNFLFTSGTSIPLIDKNEILFSSVKTVLFLGSSLRDNLFVLWETRVK